MMLPKPWQVGQAPKGLLNENNRGCGSSYDEAAGPALEPLAEDVAHVGRAVLAELHHPRGAAALLVGDLDRVGHARADLGLDA